MLAWYIFVQYREEVLVEADVHGLCISRHESAVQGLRTRRAVLSDVLGIATEPNPGRRACEVLDILKELEGEVVWFVDISEIASDVAKSELLKSAYYFRCHTTQK